MPGIENTTFISLITGWIFTLSIYRWTDIPLTTIIPSLLEMFENILQISYHP